MTEMLAAFLLLAGSFFAFVAALGLVRMPDLYTRMHAATKAGTLGAGLVLGALALYAAETGTTVRAVATLAFLILTAPIAAHAVGRAARRPARRDDAGTSERATKAREDAS